MTRSDFTIHIVDSAGEFAALRSEWSELLASSSSDCLFLTWEWLHTWWRHLGKERRLFIVTVRSASQLIAIAPFTSDRAWIGPLSIPRLEFAGSGTVGSDYLDIIIRRGCESEALQALAEFLADSATSMRLPRVTESGALTVSLATALAGCGWQIVKTAAEVCPFIDLTGQSWDGYLATLGSQHRYNFRRRLRNVMRDYDVRIHYAQSDEQRRTFLEQVVQLHLQRWNARGGSDAFDSAKVLAFHDEFSALARQRGWLRLMLITLNGQPAAAFYGFRYGHKFLFYQSGFDTAFLRSSIGLVMIGLTIQDAIREGAAEYDLLHGDESYKFLWTKTYRQLIRLELYPPGRLGQMHRNAVRMTAATKRVAKQVLKIESAGARRNVRSLL